MPDRQSLPPTLWFVLLLASLLAAPIRTTGFVAASPRPDHGRHRDGVGAGPRLDVASDPYAAPRMKALLSEEAEERVPAEAPAEARSTFPMPRRFGKGSDRRTIAPGSTPAPYPLRC